MFVAPLGSAIPDNPVVSVVTLSGETISSSGNGVVVAKLWIKLDGTLWKETRMGSVQIDAGTDWIIPNEYADSSYEVRYVNHSGAPLLVWDDLSIEGTWVDLSISRQLILFEPMVGVLQCTFDLEIRKDGGPVLATASFLLSARRFDSPGDWDFR